MARWPVSLQRPSVAIAAVLSCGAAAIHFAASPEHFAEWLPFGVAFAFLAWFQVIWAANFLARPTPLWARAAVVVNALTVMLWVWSRTAGVPVGPDPGIPEPVGVADSVATMFEVVLVVALLAPQARPGRRWRPRGGSAVAIVALVTLLVVVATTAALVALAPSTSMM